MGLVDNFRQAVWSFLMPGEYMDQQQRERLEKYDKYRRYYEGQQRRQIRVKENQADDNIIENYASLIVERSISMLLGDGVSFILPGETEQALIDEIMKANRYKILFHEAAQNSGIYGTGFFKLINEGVESKDTEDRRVTRIIAVDSRWVKIDTKPEDIGAVEGYTIRYNVGETARKEVISIQSQNVSTGEIGSWIIEEFVSDKGTQGRWVKTGEMIWPYEFPPLLHWKNLPQANDIYGQSDLEDVIPIQDRINFVSSNISKILRYHAHPKTWGSGSGMGGKMSWGADELLLVQGDNARLANLEMQSDLQSSRQFREDLKAALMDISRTVDLANMKDKVGQLTNFGLRILYNDALDKNSTKRELFGEAILELIHRLLVLEGAANSDPGEIEWPDPLPVNQSEENEADKFELENNLVSHETISRRRGNDWEMEQEKIQAEKASEENVGSLILQAFNRGQ